MTMVMEGSHITLRTPIVRTGNEAVETVDLVVVDPLNERAVYEGVTYADGEASYEMPEPAIRGTYNVQAVLNLTNNRVVKTTPGSFNVGGSL